MNYEELQAQINQATSENKNGNYTEAEQLCSDLLAALTPRDDASSAGLLLLYSRILCQLSQHLTAKFGKGYTENNLRYVRLFYSRFSNRHVLLMLNLMMCFILYIS